MTGLQSTIKVASSMLAVLLVGVAALWLWLDASAVARQSSEGVVVAAEGSAAGADGSQPRRALPSEVDAEAIAKAERLREHSAELTEKVAKLAAEERALALFADHVRISMDTLAVAGDEAEAERQKVLAAQKEAEKKKAEEAAAAQAAAEKAERERAAREREAAPPRPVQPAPAPVYPAPGQCWDDDDGWEPCDDDDWDDDDDDDWDDD